VFVPLRRLRLEQVFAAAYDAAVGCDSVRQSDNGVESKRRTQSIESTDKQQETASEPIDTLTTGAAP